MGEINCRSHVYSRANNMTYVQRWQIRVSAPSEAQVNLKNAAARDVIRTRC